jgi:hypothetical protein
MILIVRIIEAESVSHLYYPFKFFILVAARFFNI